MSAIFDADPRDDDVARLRVPPHSTEAEQSVLGGLLIDNNAFDRVADLLLETDFYRPEHRTVYVAVARLINSGRPADVVMVFDALGSKAEEVGPVKRAWSRARPRAAQCRTGAEIGPPASIWWRLAASPRGWGVSISEVGRLGNRMWGHAQKKSCCLIICHTTEAYRKSNKSLIFIGSLVFEPAL